jgi:hypothetical protein
VKRRASFNHRRRGISVSRSFFSLTFAPHRRYRCALSPSEAFDEPAWRDPDRSWRGSLCLRFPLRHRLSSLLLPETRGWVPLSMIDGLLRLFPKNPPGWLLYPEDWVGVHKLLDSIPSPLVCSFWEFSGSLPSGPSPSSWKCVESVGDSKQKRRRISDSAFNARTTAAVEWVCRLA